MTQKPPPTPADRKAARLAAALKQNLARRKAGTRAPAKPPKNDD